MASLALIALRKNALGRLMAQVLVPARDGRITFVLLRAEVCPEYNRGQLVRGLAQSSR